MNTWTMRLTLDGQPIPTEQLTVSTLMPDHGHGSPKDKDIVVTPVGDGTYTVNGIFLFMAGVWEIKFVASTASQDPAIVRLCVE